MDRVCTTTSVSPSTDPFLAGRVFVCVGVGGGGLVLCGSVLFGGCVGGWGGGGVRFFGGLRGFFVFCGGVVCCFVCVWGGGWGCGVRCGVGVLGWGGGGGVVGGFWVLGALGGGVGWFGFLVGYCWGFWGLMFNGFSYFPSGF